jgi:DNA-binding NarL/FixJ family response regulator
LQPEIADSLATLRPRDEGVASYAKPWRLGQDLAIESTNVFRMSTLDTFIVEDSPVIRENLVAALEELAPVAVVGTADDETGAVQWLGDHGHSCDLVIVDIFLKSGSGLGVLRAAHTLPTGPLLVVLSNFATPDMRTECMRLGAHAVFDKSNEIDSLIAYCSRAARLQAR